MISDSKPVSSLGTATKTTPEHQAEGGLTRDEGQAMLLKMHVKEQSAKQRGLPLAAKKTWGKLW